MANEPKFAFSASARNVPPAEQFHTAAEWEDNIAAMKRAADAKGRAKAAPVDGHDDLVVHELDHVTIWAKWNSAGSGIQRVVPKADDESAK